VLNLVQRRKDEEGGFTLVEVTMVSAILLIIMASCFAMLMSLVKTEHRTSALVGNEQEARFVLTEMARDIRAANPMRPLPGVSNASIAAYETQLQLAVGPPASQTLVRWVYDTAVGSPTYGSLLRKTIDPVNGAELSSVVRLTNVRNAERTPPVSMFSFRSQSGVDLIAAGQAADVAACAIQVHIVITANSNPGPEPFTVNSDAQLRNRLPGGVGCG
jgi:prepilin-type N-terminal cleavage/methylation domain-containing protein